MNERQKKEKEACDTAVRLSALWITGKTLEEQEDPSEAAWALCVVACRDSFPQADPADWSDGGGKEVIEQAGRVLTILEYGGWAFSTDDEDDTFASAWRIFRAIKNAAVAFDR